ncbi:nicotinate-nucleotide--dimethylbenzimidazole phosphoribosyltransferase [Streptomyces sp. Je 1-79]|uniref:nicotinate-nucleotide--dimethylbenzimidazole phosphoribosyltransferase n=1 Tax=Streptomyces sp. Je 1-79 TaxID=2943847 RepID=UPI0021A673B9|nr:nicotinate-nucleotide--dimethylbenzimidazole phosphoribosyltransferase [Streptomyces sp. Je 1-79]MCT4356746.1 nicotinate-nucleotide--dimethylbenzimidazole phosphoribosyltransferase [Streptomyces sp. Je 1-79]
MTDTGQVPGEGLPENAGMVEQPGIPAPGAYTFLDPSESAAEDDDLLLMPGAQGAWSEHQPGSVPAPPVTVPAPGMMQGQLPPMGDPLTDPLAGPIADALAAQAPMAPPVAPVAHEAVSTPAHGVPAAPESVHGLSTPAHGVPTPSHGVPMPVESGQLLSTPAHGVPVTHQEPYAAEVVTDHGYEPGILDTGAHEAAGRDSGSVDLGGVRVPPPAAAPTPPPARRPLHMGPPVPENNGGVVRSLADRGPASAVAAPAPVAAHAAASAPTPIPARIPGPPATGPEYLDDPQEQPAAPVGPQRGDIPPQGAVPWDAQPQGPVQQPMPAETVGQFVQVEGTVPTTPHLAPTPAAGIPVAEQPVQQPVAEVPAVAEARPVEAAAPVDVPVEEAPAAVPAPRDGGPAAAVPVPPVEEAAAEAVHEPVTPEQEQEQPEAPVEAEPEVETGAEAAVETVAEPEPVVEPVAEAPAAEEPAAAEPAVEPSEPTEQVEPSEPTEQVAQVEEAPAQEPVAEPLPDEAVAIDEPPTEPAPAAAEPTEAAEAVEPAAAGESAETAEPAVAAEPVAAEAATEESVAEEPVAEEQPLDEEPGAQSGAEEPGVDEPAADEPGVDEPVGAPAPGYDDAEREAVLRVMRERRDIRNGFRSDPIPHEVLLRVLEAAHTAPSVGHSQPWDFVVIRSAETRRSMHELAQRQREAYAKSLPKARAKQFKELKIEAILDTPVNIVVTADPTRGGRHTLGRYTQPQMAPYSSALAVENLWLAARAEGLGVGWVSFFDEREMVRALGLPEHLEVVAYLCVGYVDEFPEEPELMQAGWSKRRPLSWVVHEETYGRRALPGEEPHDLLQETVSNIRPLDAKALGEAWERQKRMTKPAGALGMLEIIAAQLSGLSRMCPPPIPEPAAVAIFAGDHGVHAQGVTAWPQEVTGQMVANFLGGGAVCNAFANQVGAEVCVVDVGVASDLPATPGLLPRKVRPGTGDFTTGLAMTREEVLAAIEVGIETARDLVAAGNKALLTGEMGIANTTASAALISVYTGVDPVEVTGRGTGINDEMHARKVDVVRRALDLHKPDPADPVGVLSAVGGLEHAALVGLILGAASLRTPVVLDGVSTGAAALVARAVAPESLAACIAGHRSAEPGHVAALNKLGLRPLVDLDLRLGEGTGALLALPIVQSAARAMHEVATFDSAGVTEK